MPAAGAGRKLENYTRAMSSAVRRRTIEIACAVKDQAAAGAEAIVQASEIVERSLGPSSAALTKFVNDAAAVTGAKAAETASDGCTVEISCAVKSDAAVGIQAVAAAGKVPDYLFLAGRRQHEDGAEAVGSASGGGAVGVPGAVKRYPASGISAIGSTGEVVKLLVGGCLGDSGKNEEDVMAPFNLAQQIYINGVFILNSSTNEVNGWNGASNA